LTDWKLVEETKHGKLFRSPKGSLKIQLRCSECNMLIEGVAKPKDLIRKHYYKKWVKFGNPYATCPDCDAASSWKLVEVSE